MRGILSVGVAALFVLMTLPGSAMGAAADVGGAVDVILSPCEPGYDTRLARGVGTPTSTDGVYWIDGQLYTSGSGVREDIWSYNLSVGGICAPAVYPKPVSYSFMTCLTCIYVTSPGIVDVVA